MDEEIRITEEEGEGSWLFRVLITGEGDSSTEHRVTLKESDYRRLTAGKISPARLVELSFKFLLEREPKETIISRFDLPVISRYFPEYEEVIAQHLGG